jgi:hypothetical protein
MNLEPVEGLEDNNKNMYEVGDIDKKTREKIMGSQWEIGSPDCFFYF